MVSFGQVPRRRSGATPPRNVPLHMKYLKEVLEHVGWFGMSTCNYMPALVKLSQVWNVQSGLCPQVLDPQALCFTLFLLGSAAMSNLKLLAIQNCLQRTQNVICKWQLTWGKTFIGAERIPSLPVAVQLSPASARHWCFQRVFITRTDRRIIYSSLFRKCCAVADVRYTKKIVWNDQHKDDDI